MRVIRQIRYFGDNDNRNSNTADGSTKVTASSLSSGEAFQLNGYSIAQIGIQTLPGMQFTINGGTSAVAIGQTGIYELELNDRVSITRIQFYSSTLNLINGYNYLIVDLIYESNS